MIEKETKTFPERLEELKNFIEHNASYYSLSDRTAVILGKAIDYHHLRLITHWLIAAATACHVEKQANGCMNLVRQGKHSYEAGCIARLSQNEPGLLKQFCKFIITEYGDPELTRDVLRFISGIIPSRTIKR